MLLGQKIKELRLENGVLQSKPPIKYPLSLYL